VRTVEFPAGLDVVLPGVKGDVTPRRQQADRLDVVAAVRDVHPSGCPSSGHCYQRDAKRDRGSACHFCVLRRKDPQSLLQEPTSSICGATHCCGRSLESYEEPRHERLGPTRVRPSAAAPPCQELPYNFFMSCGPKRANHRASLSAGVSRRGSHAGDFFMPTTWDASCVGHGSTSGRLRRLHWSGRHQSE
jgi:hypothetical protein